MTDPINQISINGETTTFLNFANPVVPVGIYGRNFFPDLLTEHLGAKGTLWNTSTGTGGIDSYKIRFPVPWETITGDVTETSSGTAANNRVGFSVASTLATAGYGIDSTNGTTPYRIIAGNVNLTQPGVMAVINDYSVILVGCNEARTTLSNFIYMGWLKDGQFTGSQFPRNCVQFRNGVVGTEFDTSIRVFQENLTTSQSLLTSNPALTCATFTADADSSDVIIRDSAAPNNYIGKLWNMIVLPSSAVIGSIYKNIGIDPDTGVVETNQKAFWLCCSVWGDRKLGMRIWTEGVS